MAEFAADAGLGFAIPMDVGVGDSRDLLALGEVIVLGIFITQQIYHHGTTTGKFGTPQG